MNKPLAIASLAEAGTGVILLAYPQIVVQLLFGAEIMGVGVVMSRLAGIALLGLGVACWPGKTGPKPIYGMVAYSALAMLYLSVVGARGMAGILLWPAVAVHATLSILLVWAWWKQRVALVGTEAHR